ncbi:branched-chain amino acid ABC transporter permease [Tistrella mobilis]
MMGMGGLETYAVFFLTSVGIYAIVCLALNVQWGLSGQFNFGIVAFYALGAYTSAILTGPDSGGTYLGGFGLPLPIGLIGGMIVAGLLGLFIGLVCLNLRADYLAIATIGIAEIVRLFLKNEAWLTNGVRGIPGIPRPFFDSGYFELAYLALVLVLVVLVYLAIERARKAPWGRVLRAIRENEDTAAAAGKDVVGFRIQAFVFGAAIMGLAGGLYAHFIGFISSEAFMPEVGTFLIWVMLIAGGSGNNKGAILGALVIWIIWSGSEFIISQVLPASLTTQAGALRLLLIGVLLQVILLTRPAGLLSEERLYRTGRTAQADPKAHRREVR